MLLKRQNLLKQLNNKTLLYKQPYQIINLIFAGIFISIMIYSGFFSAEKNNHPIDCQVYESTGKPCPTCGLSRSFSEIVRFELDKAIIYNKYSLKIFSFFFIELVLRLCFFIILYFNFIRLRIILITDIIISVVLFLYCFSDLMFYV